MDAAQPLGVCNTARQRCDFGGWGKVWGEQNWAGEEEDQANKEVGMAVAPATQSLP